MFVFEGVEVEGAAHFFVVLGGHLVDVEGAELLEEEVHGGGEA